MGNAEKKGMVTTKKRGRPPKKEYDRDALMRELLDKVVKVYAEKQEIKATAEATALSPNKVRKLLITAGVLEYPETAMIQELMAKGKTVEEIQKLTGLGRASINFYLPYSKVIYKMPVRSQNAERVRRYKERKKDNHGSCVLGICD